MPITAFSTVTAKLSNHYISMLPKQFDIHNFMKEACGSLGAHLSAAGSAPETEYTVSGDWFTLEHLHVVLTKLLSDFLIRQQSLSERISDNEGLTDQQTERENGVPSQGNADLLRAPSSEPEDPTIIQRDSDSVPRKGPEGHNDVRSSAEVSRSQASLHTIDNILSVPWERTCSNPTTDLVRQKEETVTDECESNEDKYVDDADDDDDYGDEDGEDADDDISSNPNIQTTCNFDQRPRSRRNNSFRCIECDFIGKSRNALFFHKYKTHLAKATKCNLCDKVFSDERYMKRHMLSHGRSPQECKICGKQYKEPKSFKKHMKTHRYNYVKPKYNCDLCCKVFQTSQGLESHKSSDHDGDRRRFLCAVCGKSFTTNNTLQQHSNSHTGSKPYKCDRCPKSFGYESVLREHRLTHSDVKMFPCPTCSKSFSRRSALQMHKKIHEDTREFQCSECGRAFTQKQALERHKRSHKGDRPYLCKVCGRKFGNPSVIRRHLISMHKIKKDVSEWKEDIEVLRIETRNAEGEGERETSNINKNSDTAYMGQGANATGACVNDKTRGLYVVNSEEHRKQTNTLVYQSMPLAHAHLNTPINYQTHNDTNLSEGFPVYMQDSSVQTSSQVIEACHNPGVNRVVTSDSERPMSHDFAGHDTLANSVIPPSEEQYPEHVVSTISAKQMLNGSEKEMDQQFSNEFFKDLNPNGGIYSDHAYVRASLSTDAASYSHEETGSLSVGDPVNMEHAETGCGPYVDEPTSVTAREDNDLEQRLQQMEPPDNVSVSSLYAYYTNMTSQYPHSP